MTKDLLELPRNKALADLYRRNWPTLIDIWKRFDGLSHPQLHWVHPDYEKADIRLVFVGKETRGWDWTNMESLTDEERRQALSDVDRDQAVERLMQFFREGELGINYSGKASFCGPCHELYHRLNPNADNHPLGFVTLNASMMDQDGNTPNSEVRNALIPTKILTDEIRILEPHVVVFFTGPSYDSMLKGWYPDIELDEDSRLFSRVKAAGLPKSTFRTYHPRSLNWQSKRKYVYDQIVAAVTTSA